MNGIMSFIFSFLVLLQSHMYIPKEPHVARKSQFADPWSRRWNFPCRDAEVSDRDDFASLSDMIDFMF